VRVGVGFADKQEFLGSVMKYMPPAHAQFIRKLRKPPHIRQFGLQRHVYSLASQSNQIKFIKHTSNVCAAIEIKRNSKIYNSLNRQ